MVFFLVMKIVGKVIYPIITKPESVAGFYLKAIAFVENLPLTQHELKYQAEIWQKIISS